MAHLLSKCFRWSLSYSKLRINFTLNLAVDLQLSLLARKKSHQSWGSFGDPTTRWCVLTKQAQITLGLQTEIGGQAKLVMFSKQGRLSLPSRLMTFQRLVQIEAIPTKAEGDEVQAKEVETTPYSRELQLYV